MIRYKFFLLILCVLPVVAFAQSDKSLLFLPSVNINKKLKNDWSVNFKTESRQLLAEEEFYYEYLLTDISMAVAKKVGINTSIIGGYLIRLEEGQVIHRSIQQLNILQRNISFKLAHRIASDQTFEEGDDPEIRVRYRLSSEFPLNGESLDPKEFFLKLGNEYLNAFQGNTYDLEIRGMGFLGYVVTPRNKVELGLDYRIDSFLDGETRNRFFIGVNYYLSI